MNLNQTFKIIRKIRKLRWERYLLGQRCPPAGHCRREALPPRAPQGLPGDLALSPVPAPQVFPSPGHAMPHVGFGGHGWVGYKDADDVGGGVHLVFLSSTPSLPQECASPSGDSHPGMHSWCDQGVELTSVSGPCPPPQRWAWGHVGCPRTSLLSLGQSNQYPTEGTGSRRLGSGAAPQLLRVSPRTPGSSAPPAPPAPAQRLPDLIPGPRARQAEAPVSPWLLLACLDVSVWCLRLARAVRGLVSTRRPQHRGHLSWQESSSPLWCCRGRPGDIAGTPPPAYGKKG